MKKILNRNILYAASILALVVLAFVLVVKAVSASIVLADPNDSFEIISPTPNSTLKGTALIKFKLFDDDKTQLDYDIKLFDTSCSESYYGTISAGKVQSSANAINTLSWDSSKTSTQSSLNDGFYCVRICTVLTADSGAYSACNGRYIYLANNNQSPSITSTPTKTDFLVGESFSYDINATDPDGDSLTYRIVNAPGGFTINGTSGLVSSGVLNTPGTYTITVSAADFINPAINQTFSFTVKENAIVEPPTSEEPTEPEQEEEEEEQENDTDEKITDIFVVFNRPKASEVFSTDKIIVSWDIDNSEIVASQNLEYSTDLENWYGIASDLNSERTYYVWNISTIEDETYYLRLTLEDSKGSKTQQSSPAFKIERNQEQEIESGVVATDIVPADNEEYKKDELETITFDLSPSENAEIDADSLQVILDEVDITEDCELSSNKVACELEELDSGSHVLRIQAQDTAGEELIREVTFAIESEEDESAETPALPSDPDSEPKINYFLITIIVILVLLFLIIPWILIGMLGRRKRLNRNESNTTKVTVNTPNPSVTYMNPPGNNSMPGNYIVPYNNSTTVNSGSRPMQPPVNNSHTGKAPLG